MTLAWLADQYPCFVCFDAGQLQVVLVSARLLVTLFNGGVLCVGISRLL